jgi:hypothetical protein
MIGVAMRNLRNPRFIGDISVYIIRTAINDPAQTRLIKMSNIEVINLFLFIFQIYAF